MTPFLHQLKNMSMRHRSGRSQATSSDIWTAMKGYLQTIHSGITCSQAHSPELRYATGTVIKATGGADL
jgi:hypothetical protein